MYGFALLSSGMSCSQSGAAIDRSGHKLSWPCSSCADPAATVACRMAPLSTERIRLGDPKRAFSWKPEGSKPAWTGSDGTYQNVE